MKTITITILTLIFCSFSLAYFPGEEIVFPNEMQTENLVYTIIHNNSPVNLHVDVNSTNITIRFPSDMHPQSFDIVFLENTTKTIVKTINSGGSSGGSTRTITKTETEYIDRIVNRTIETESNCENVVQSQPNPTELNEHPEETEKSNLIWWILEILAIIILIAAIIKIRNREEVEDDGTIYYE